MPLGVLTGQGVGAHADDDIGGIPLIDFPGESYYTNPYQTLRSPLRGSVLASATMGTQPQSVNTSTFRPQTTVLFLNIKTRAATPPPPTVTSVSGFGGQWSLIPNTSQTQSSQHMETWVGIGCDNTATSYIHYELDPTLKNDPNGGYVVFEWLGGLSAKAPVASSQGANFSAWQFLSRTVPALQSPLNTYAAAVWHPTSENTTPLNGAAIELFDLANGINPEINYLPGDPGGIEIGGSWATSATRIINTFELTYDPIAVGPLPVWPTQPNPRGGIADIATMGLPFAPTQEVQQVPVAGGNITLLPDVALATASGLIPTLIVTVLPAEADATAVANVPTIQVSVLPAVAAATASALTPTVIVTVLPAVATAVADAILPASSFLFLDQPTSAFKPPWPLSLGGPPVLAQQPPPFVSPAISGDITILPAAALATAAGLVPTLIVTLLPVTATATGSALVPTLQVTVQPAVAASTASGLVPTLQATILPGVATATGTALTPTVQVTILPAAASATAIGLVPNIAIDIRILPPVAAATALAMPPTIFIGTVGGPVRDPQAKLTGALAEVGLTSVDGKAVLVVTEGQVVLIDTDGKVTLTETEGKADLL